jgi:hypothetical protein
MRATVGTAAAFPPVGLARQPPLPPKHLSLSPRPLVHVSPSWLTRRRTAARRPALGRGKPPSSSPRSPLFPFLGAAPFSPARPWRGPASAAPARRTRLARPWRAARPPCPGTTPSPSALVPARRARLVRPLRGRPWRGYGARARLGGTLPRGGPASTPLGVVRSPAWRGSPTSVPRSARGPGPLPAQPAVARRGMPAPARGAQRACARLGVPCPCPLPGVAAACPPRRGLELGQRAAPRAAPLALPRCAACARLAWCAQ